MLIEGRLVGRVEVAGVAAEAFGVFGCLLRFGGVLIDSGSTNGVALAPAVLQSFSS